MSTSSALPSLHDDSVRGVHPQQAIIVLALRELLALGENLLQNSLCSTPLRAVIQKEN